MEHQTRNIVVIGAEESGKSTLVNALLRWDILPQAVEGSTCHTETCITVPLEPGWTITDTPGYDVRAGQADPQVRLALADARWVLVVPDVDLLQPQWGWSERNRLYRKWAKRERQILRQLLQGTQPNRVLFVLPYDTEEWLPDKAPTRQLRRWAAARFGFRKCFCVDSLKALIGEIEADEEAVSSSGIRPLRMRLLGQ